MPILEPRLIRFPFSSDERGLLTVVEDVALPFPIRRVFYMHAVPAGVERGGHAHPHTDQLLIPVKGEVHIAASHGGPETVFHLNDPNQGLYLARMTWTRLFGFSSDAVVLVLASTPYTPGDVIRDCASYLSKLAVPT